MTFKQAWRKLPACITGTDPLGHTTIADLYSLVLLQVDLYLEGDESDITTQRQLEQCQRYVEMTRPQSP